MTLQLTLEEFYTEQVDTDELALQNKDAVCKPVHACLRLNFSYIDA